MAPVGFPGVPDETSDDDSEEPEETKPKRGRPRKVVPEKWSKDNPHPDKGIYLKVPLSTVELESTAYMGVATTGGMGITNIKFSFPFDLGDGETVMLTYHAGWGNLTIERSKAYIDAHKLKGKRSGLQVSELPDYKMVDGVSNVEDLLGPLKEKS